MVFASEIQLTEQNSFLENIGGIFITAYCQSTLSRKRSLIWEEWGRSPLFDL